MIGLHRSESRATPTRRRSTVAEPVGGPPVAWASVDRRASADQLLPVTSPGGSVVFGREDDERDAVGRRPGFDAPFAVELYQIAGLHRVRHPVETAVEVALEQVDEDVRLGVAVSRDGVPDAERQPDGPGWTGERPGVWLPRQVGQRDVFGGPDGSQLSNCR